MAISLWKRGFQVDACADMHNAQPADRSVRLPFYSRWPSPHSSGVDMLQQDWSRRVHWCNPPFVLIPRVLALLRAQRACAAVVIPNGRKAAWARLVQRGAAGVIARFDYDPQDLRYASTPAPPETSPYRHTFAVVFFDFSRQPPSSSFYDCVSAERISATERGTKFLPLRQ